MTNATAIAVLRGASKVYGTVQALDNVDFTIAAGEVRALLGKNGAGKSTLIKLLSGVEAPDMGDVEVAGAPLDGVRIERAHELGVRTVYQELSLIDSMSVAENMYMGTWPRTRAKAIDHSQMRAKTADALKRLDLEIDPDAMVERLSTADRQLVEISRALEGSPKLLILDEPTSSLPAWEVARVLDAVRRVASFGVAVIYVSHRLAEIRQIADTASVMRDGQLIATRPLKDAESGDIARMMVGDDGSGGSQAVLPEEQPLAPSSATVLTVRNVKAPPLLEQIDLEIREGEVLGLAGVLGSGRTELLKVLAGITQPIEGELSLFGRAGPYTARSALRAGVGMTPENRRDEGIFPNLPVASNLVMTDLSAVSTGPVLSLRKILSSAKSLIDRLSIKAEPSTEILKLSGGNQQKAVIGRWLHADTRLLLMDEPTRGVDIGAKNQLYALVRNLAAGGRSVVFVSSELEELSLVCDRVLVLRNGRITEEFVRPHLDTGTILTAAMLEE
jgi:ABC-type sugar transport system ATPase subunit